jgi:hypothetical protein
VCLCLYSVRSTAWLLYVPSAILKPRSLLYSPSWGGRGGVHRQITTAAISSSLGPGALPKKHCFLSLCRRLLGRAWCWQRAEKGGKAFCGRCKVVCSVEDLPRYFKLRVGLGKVGLCTIIYSKLWLCRNRGVVSTKLCRQKMEDVVMLPVRCTKCTKYGFW